MEVSSEQNRLMTPGMSRIVLVFAGLLLLLVSRYLVPEDVHVKTSDEAYYYHYAQHIADNGVRGFGDIIDWYADSELNRYHPSPARPAYVFLGALLFKVFGPSYTMLIYISYVSFILFCGVCFYYARKLFSKDYAYCLIMVVASSPLMLGMSRVALNDSMLNLFWGCSVWAFMDLVNKRTTGKLALLVVFLTFSLLIKEASVLLIFFMIVFSLCFARFYKVRVHVRDVAVLSIVPLVITAVVYLLVSGGPGHCMALLHAMYLTHFVDQANPYALKYSAGPWFRYFVDLLMISPVIFLIAAGYAGHLIIRRSRDWKHMCLLIYFASVYLPLSLLQHTKVVRYVINLEMVLAVFCVSGILELFKRHFQEDNLKGALWVLILVCTVSYNLFYDVFVHNGLLDPITFNLAQIQRFIP